MAEKARTANAPRGRGRGKAKPGNATGSRGRVAGVGDNSKAYHAIPDEVILRSIKKLDEDRAAMAKVKVELDELRGRYRDRRKQYKKDGLNLDAFDNICTLRALDLGKVQIDSADTGRYLRILEHPLATQLELFGNMQTPTPAVDANLQGQMAGKNAESPGNNPYTQGTEQFTQWAEGWATGQEMNQQTLN